jgi:hypothetical protein
MNDFEAQTVLGGAKKLAMLTGLHVEHVDAARGASNKGKVSTGAQSHRFNVGSVHGL